MSILHAMITLRWTVPRHDEKVQITQKKNLLSFYKVGSIPHHRRLLTLLLHPPIHLQEVHRPPPPESNLVVE